MRQRMRSEAVGQAGGCAVLRRLLPELAIVLEAQGERSVLIELDTRAHAPGDPVDRGLQRKAFAGDSAAEIAESAPVGVGAQADAGREEAAQDAAVREFVAPADLQ